MASIGASDVSAVHADKAGEAARLGGHYPAASILKAMEAGRGCGRAIGGTGRPRVAVSAMGGAIRAALS